MLLTRLFHIRSRLIKFFVKCSIAEFIWSSAATPPQTAGSRKSCTVSDLGRELLSLETNRSASVRSYLAAAYNDNVWKLMNSWKAVVRGAKRANDYLSRRLVVTAAVLSGQRKIRESFDEIANTEGEMPKHDLALTWGFDETTQWLSSTKPQTSALKKFMKEGEKQSAHVPITKAKPGKRKRYELSSESRVRRNVLRHSLVQTGKINIVERDNDRDCVDETIFLRPKMIESTTAMTIGSGIVSSLEEEFTGGESLRVWISRMVSTIIRTFIFVFVADRAAANIRLLKMFRAMAQKVNRVRRGVLGTEISTRFVCGSITKILQA